jgi:hypothetical protein
MGRNDPFSLHSDQDFCHDALLQGLRVGFVDIRIKGLFLAFFYLVNQSNQ